MSEIMTESYDRWENEHVTDEMFTGNELPFHLVQKHPDPMGCRVSAGGNNEQRYMVYRGDLTEIRKILLDCITTIDYKLNQQK